MNFLKMTASPHMHGPESTQRIMLDVLISLVPAWVWGIYVFGTRVITVTAVCVLASILTEYLYRKLAKKNNTVSDLSAAVTGLLFAMTLPVSIPLWICVIGAVFAIAVVKQLYGGIGKNVVNPALAARVFLFCAFPSEMAHFDAVGVKYPFFGKAYGALDAVAGATPLRAVVAGDVSAFTVKDLFFGCQPGTIGEISELLLLAGGLYLLFRRVITWHIPVAYIGTVAVVSLLFPMGGAAALPYMAEGLFCGGLFLGAIFMATDYVTSPATSLGRIIYGVGCGAITLFIRYFGGYPEGVSFAVLIMNLLVWYIDSATKPKVFGGVKNVKAK